MPNFVSLETSEGTVSGTDTFNLSRISGHISITNDHATASLTFRFATSGDVATLKAGETISMEFSTFLVQVIGTNVPYRIWVYS